MSYTLNGRIQSRLVSAVPALLLALGLHTWWALEVTAAMLAVGVVLDAAVYHRALAYQPGWLAVPLGALELGLTYAAVRSLGIEAPLRWALALYAVGWIAAQVFGHALFPRLRLEYAEAGGELGRAGSVTAAAVLVTLVAGLGSAYATRPPTVHLHGVVQGPLVIRHAQTLVGGIVRGGIVVRASHVTLRRVTVLGGENGIAVEDAHDVLLDHVRVAGSTVDGIHVRRSAVMIHDCVVSAPGGPWVQGIDISFSMHAGMSSVDGCRISGVREGIATHVAMVMIENNTVGDSSLRGITMGEMSMGSIRNNDVVGAGAVGIYCVDHSECEISHNTVAGAGTAIEAHYYADARLRHNTVAGSVTTFDHSTIGR